MLRKSRKKQFIYGNDESLKIAPRLAITKGIIGNSVLTQSETLNRFEMIHSINETLHCEDGSWVPHEFADYYGKGISIEEVALRVRGYISAYQAVKNPLYLERAKSGCDYLLNERIYNDGHIHLQGHMTIDLPYSFAGEALVQMWKLDNSLTTYLYKAQKIGDRLIEYQIAGSVNHAVVPVQFLGLLYQVTGENKYIKNSLKRIMKAAIPMQLPYGGWLGHESWIWYHALIVRSLIIGYVSLPNTLEYYAKRDKIACSIIAGINYFIACQNDDGSFPIRPPEPICEHSNDKDYREQKAIYTSEGCFLKVSENNINYGSWNGYVIDALVTAYELLDMKEIIP